MLVVDEWSNQWEVVLKESIGSESSIRLEEVERHAGESSNRWEGAVKKQVGRKWGHRSGQGQWGDRSGYGE